jgi:hypothetical protein
LADEQAVKFSVKMDTKMLAVAEIGRGERGSKVVDLRFPSGPIMVACATPGEISTFFSPHAWRSKPSPSLRILSAIRFDWASTPRRIVATSSRKAIIRLRPSERASSSACCRAVTTEKPTAVHIATTRMPNAMRMVRMIVRARRGGEFVKTIADNISFSRGLG